MDTAKKKRLTVKQYEEFLRSIAYDVQEAIGELHIMKGYMLITGAGVQDMVGELTTLLNRIEEVVDCE